MSRNADPREGLTQDQTLRRSGVRDWSDENAAGNSEPYKRVRQDIDEPQIGGTRPGVFNDQMLHEEFPPARIDNLHELRVGGFAAPSNAGGPAPNQSGEYMRVGHVPMEHPVIGRQGQQQYPGNTYSDDAHIPSFRIGDPL